MAKQEKKPLKGKPFPEIEVQSAVAVQEEHGVRSVEESQGPVRVTTMAAAGVRLRDHADDVKSGFTQVDNDPAAGLREILGMGKEDWEAFTRTELKDEREINRWAAILTADLEELSEDPSWRDRNPWVRMVHRGAVGTAYLSIKAYLRVSLGGAGRQEGVETYTHMVVPEWSRGQTGKGRGK